jgi:hypothetical protein
MLTQEQLVSRKWLEETKEELQTLKTKLNGNTNAVISSLISGAASKLLIKQ